MSNEVKGVFTKFIHLLLIGKLTQALYMLCVSPVAADLSAIDSVTQVHNEDVCYIL